MIGASDRRPRSEPFFVQRHHGGMAVADHREQAPGLGQELLIDSIIGSSFRVRCLENTRVGGIPAVIPEVTGRAHMTGEHRFVLDERDRLGGGFFVR